MDTEHAPTSMGCDDLCRTAASGSRDGHLELSPFDRLQNVARLGAEPARALGLEPRGDAHLLLSADRDALAGPCLQELRQKLAVEKRTLLLDRGAIRFQGIALSAPAGDALFAAMHDRAATMAASRSLEVLPSHVDPVGVSEPVTSRAATQSDPGSHVRLMAEQL